MNDNTTWVELARLPVEKMQDVLLARFVGRDEATKIGFSPVLITRLATVISEITRNVVQHAGGPGEIHFYNLTEGSKVGIRIVVSDKGKGIELPERFLEEGKIGMLGSGLSGTRRLVDYFKITSAPGEGTTVTVEFWKKEGAT